ncbi:MAG: hypothetical protein ACKOQU_07685 [Acidimicrobiaceae bacterium]
MVIEKPILRTQRPTKLSEVYLRNKLRSELGKTIKITTIKGRTNVPDFDTLTQMALSVPELIVGIAHEIAADMKPTNATRAIRQYD